MRLLGGVFNDGEAVGQGSGQHDVHGGAHRNDVQIDLRALQTAVPGGGVDIAAPHIYIGAHGGEALDVLVDGPPTQIAAAGRRHLGGAKAAQQRADQVIAGADLPGQLVGDRLVAHVGAVDIHGGAVYCPHLRAQVLQNIQNKGHVADLGDILNTANAVYQQSRGDDSHSGIFRAADIDGAI